MDWEEWVNKPQPIEVIKVTRKNVEKIAKEIGSGKVDISYENGMLESMRIEIPNFTSVRVAPGDYIVRNLDGYCYRLTKAELKKKYKRA